MKNGLRQRLNDYIKSYKGEVVPHDTIKQLCKAWGYRESNAERRLRASESPDIERLMKNGAIVGYRYLDARPDAAEWFKPPPKPLSSIAQQFKDEYEERIKQKTNEQRVQSLQAPTLFT